jgi:hypothetical protein
MAAAYRIIIQAPYQIDMGLKLVEGTLIRHRISISLYQIKYKTRAFCF